MAELIEVLFRFWTIMSPKNYVLFGGAHLHYLVNATELPVKLLIEASGFY